MAQIPYPPYIEGIIPAFCGGLLNVPYTDNLAVGRNEYNGFNLRLKNAYDGSIVYTGYNQPTSQENVAQFDVGDAVGLTPGQYYKVQIAYVSEGQIGTYSTVGVTKYSENGVASIDGMSHSSMNARTGRYVGRYVPHESDIYEKEYSYEFNIYDYDYNLLVTSGEHIHNSDLDYDEFILSNSLDENQIYFAEYKVTTLNGLKVSSGYYKMIEQNLIDGDYDVTLAAELNPENGYITLKMSTANTMNGDVAQVSVSGSYVISRASRTNDYKDWNEITRFKLKNVTLDSKIVFKDFTVAQGEHYKYIVQQYNGYGVYSKKMESNEVFVDFYDMFLFDGEKQLKIKFNPKVTTFKDVILEQKTDTIGGKYPIIYRNGNVRYRELALSGLISFLSDEENLFLSTDNYLIDPELQDYKTTQLTGYNIANERHFKLKVLEWLTNGKPKLFKSPIEGNYIVRLLNVTMTPSDQVGRMLHTFNSSAYEIDDLNWENMKKYQFIRLVDFKDYTLQWRSVRVNKDITPNDILNHSMAYNIKLEGPPGSKYQIRINGERMTIMIGATGVYEAYVPEGISEIRRCDGVIFDGVLTYSFQEEVKSVFDQISNIGLSEIIQISLFGGNYKQSIDGKRFKIEREDLSVVKHRIKDIKRIFSKWTSLEFRAREIYNLNEVPSTVIPTVLTNNLAVFDVDPALYTINKKYYEKVYYYTGIETELNYFYFEVPSYSSKVQYNNTEFLIADIIGQQIEVPNIKGFEEIIIGNGVTALIGYHSLNIGYDMEEEIKSDLSKTTSYSSEDFYRNNPSRLNYLKTKYNYLLFKEKLRERGVFDYEESYG